ncbi:interleukin-13 receptor subunit alpha-1 [Amblyraja radiata]|uniref:interleukin-13 receptor subunit alpha-1 n=1 Tax=Amblyraja radiata TaxID=386614 RepID=UPI0014032691|nr:interleukin-13 receptor subunit alpha-1 [Amblyraja radiata]
MSGRLQQLLAFCVSGWLALTARPVKAANCSVELPAPTNLTVVLRGIGHVNCSWSWLTPRHLENDTSSLYQYKSSFQYDDGRWEQRKINSLLYREQCVDRNRKVIFKVRVYVKNETGSCRSSNWVSITIPSDEGVVAVENFICVFYNFEYVNCTWDVNPTAPDAIYHFHYWQRSMASVQNCSDYIYKGNRRAGCQIDGDKLLKESALNSRVQGVSARGKIKPFYYKLESFAFVKLRPPGRINVARIREGFNVSWEIPSDWKSHCTKYEARVCSVKRDSCVVYECQNAVEKINDADTKSKNSIQVRAMYDVCGSSGIWSEWTPKHYFGEDAGTTWNWSIALLIFIPVLVAVTAIMLFPKLKQLRRWILPPIPDPGRLLKDMFLDGNGDHSVGQLFVASA